MHNADSNRADSSTNGRDAVWTSGGQPGAGRLPWLVCCPCRSRPCWPWPAAARTATRPAAAAAPPSRSGKGWTGAEAKTFTHLVGVYQAQHPGTKVGQPVRQQRRHAAEGADRGARRQPAGHRLPVRVVGAQRGPDPAGGQPDQGGPAARRELERLLGRRAGRGHRQRQGDRHPGAGGQPGRGLQQDAVRQGRPAAAQARTGPGRSSWPTPRSSPTRPASSTAPRT